MESVYSSQISGKYEELKEHARNMRIRALKMSYECGNSAHLGGGLSYIDTMAVLYGAVMNVKDKYHSYDKRDKFILSKGHGVLGLYSALAEFGLISDELISSFMKDGSDLMAHPVMKPEIGIEASTGSLGQGISLAVGMALSAKKKHYDYQTYVICGNGECNEGSVWEACMSAVSYRLDNLTIYIDNNHMQSDGDSKYVMNVSDNYLNMFKALGFQTIEVDGHSISELYSAFILDRICGVPKVIVGNTIKGKGVSFMENNNDWHHNRLTKDQFDAAMKELINTI